KAVLKLKREHNVTMHALEEKSRLKRQLTNNINHELKTPIGVIKGYLDTIIANPDMDQASRDHFIRKALEHANRLTNLMNDVSAITRLEEGGAMINTEELDYHDLVYTVMSDLSDTDVLGKMDFVYDIPTDCMIEGNSSLLSGMIMNLAKNAAAYSKGTECGVRLIGEDDKFYKFVFFDNGVGVSEEHIPHLFERFYRIDSGRSRKNGGTGLGLPIVQNTVLAHGGTIEIRNNPDGGLEFVYTLPKANAK
ncbi:MAG: HAMP domain-containing histidine kinase, partial [Muribaculaceae bacterium]|nr:HAMP domain-containing histidine kinase [Muribaculaceae bacterium]